jgi:predicted phosphodiesterase
MSFKKNVLFFVIIITILTSCASQNLTIGIVGDQFGSHETNKSYDIMTVAVDKIKKHNPDILIHVGDIVESKRGINSFEDYKSNFELATTIMNNTNKPWILTVGDHGVAPPGFKAASNDRSREEWFLKCSQIFDTPISDKLYYSTNINGYHIVSLYSLENLHTDPRWGSIFLNKIGIDQLEWLKDDLQKNKNSNGIIVIVHHPHWYVWSNWMEVHQVLREYPVKAVIAGHYHYDQDDGTIDGIRYLVMGSSGGVVKNMDANSGGVQEYGILKLKDSNIEELNLYEVNSDSILEWTPRKSMDRIQALSCMLDNLWQDIKLERIDLNLTNVNSLDGKVLELNSIVNPIDIPIELEISFTDSIIQNSGWYIGDAITSGDKTINLEPGENVGWANYTSVGHWYKKPGIWRGELIDSTDHINEITLSVEVNFTDTEQRSIKRTVTYPVN